MYVLLMKNHFYKSCIVYCNILHSNFEVPKSLSISYTVLSTQKLYISQLLQTICLSHLENWALVKVLFLQSKSHSSSSLWQEINTICRLSYFSSSLLYLSLSLVSRCAQTKTLLIGSHTRVYIYVSFVCACVTEFVH